MKTENWILLIGASAILGWYYYNKGKAKNTDVSNAQTPSPSSESDVVPRKDMRRDFRIVMPSDLVSTRVRQKSEELTNRRYAVDTAKLV